MLPKTEKKFYYDQAKANQSVLCGYNETRVGHYVKINSWKANKAPKTAMISPIG